MTTAARIWNHEHVAQLPGSSDRLNRYERILGHIATGVFILEPTGHDIDSMQVTFVNEMGAQFFGRVESGDAQQVLCDAGH